MAEKFTRWDTAEHLRDEEDITAYLEAASEENDPALMVIALGNVARARNVMQLAKDAGMSRAGLYKALSGERNPSFATVSKIANAIGYRLEFKPFTAPASPSSTRRSSAPGRAARSGRRA